MWRFFLVCVAVSAFCCNSCRESQSVQLPPESFAELMVVRDSNGWFAAFPDADRLYVSISSKNPNEIMTRLYAQIKAKERDGWRLDYQSVRTSGDTYL